MHAGRQKDRNMLFLSLVTLTFDLDLQTRPSKGPHVFRVHLAQIRSAIPEIFHTQAKKPQTDGAKNRTFHSSLHVVKSIINILIANIVTYRHSQNIYHFCANIDDPADYITMSSCVFYYYY